MTDAGQPTQVIYGVVDSRERHAHAAVAQRCLDLTLSWSRWGWSGSILLDSDPDALLARAAERGATRCFIQSIGHVIAEYLTPWGAVRRELVDALGDALEGHDALAAMVSHPQLRERGEAASLLVDLVAWRDQDRPGLERTEAGSLRWCGAPRLAWTEQPSSVFLQPAHPSAPPVLERLIVDPSSVPAAALDEVFDAASVRFIAHLQRVLDGCQTNVFLFNVESYEDLPHEPPGAPLATLYSVAAGFKPNATLARYGFDAATRVVMFDYSQPALTLRRLLVERWDGRDLPAFFCAQILPELPPASTQYCLAGIRPDGGVDRTELDSRWSDELERWGGAEAFAEHWRRYAALDHEFVHCDLLLGPEVLFERVRDEQWAAMWWSNAFASVYSNWTWSVDARVDNYKAFVRALVRRCPGLSVFGADACNIPVNSQTALDYSRSLDAHTNALEPHASYARRLRF